MYAKAIIFRQASEADLVSIVRLLADDCIGATREKPLEPLVDAYRNAFKAISADKNQLLAVAKLSKPQLKSFAKELLVKVKLDY